MSIPVFVEIAVIIFLLALNGLFAMTEIALVSSRKARLKVLAEGGSGRARLALEMAESPNRFLSTVQIGITLVGIFAGAFGGATLAGEIAAAVSGISWLAPYARPIGLAVVVLLITYLSLVMGELVPKRIGLSRPEAISMFMAPIMQLVSRLTGPAVSFLTFSTDALLRLLPLRPSKEAKVDEEEVKVLMREGLRAGAFNQIESQMVERVLELDRVPVRDIMTPRAQIIWINRNDSHEAIWHKIVVSNHSWFPVYENNRDNVVGLISVKAIYANLAAGVGVRVADLVVPPVIIPSSLNLLAVLETFKRTGRGIALVADEFGTITGLVTFHDLVEAIAGDFPSQDERAKPAAIKRPDGSWLVDALIEIERLETLLTQVDFGSEKHREYQTLAGFLLQNLGHVPKEGETIEASGHVFEIIDMDRHRIDKVLILPPKANPSPNAPRDQFQI